MPKLLIAQSQKHKKDRRAATSSLNLKKLIEKRLKKDNEDVSYTVVTINTKMKLANVVAIMNSSIDKLAEHEGAVSVETYTVDPEKTRGRWEIAAMGKAEGKKEGDEDKPKKKKKKKKSKEE